MRSFHAVNKNFTALFGITEGEERGGESDSSEFDKNYGWIYSAKMVSEFENISLDSVWSMPVLQFLNDLTYLKVKRKLDAEQQKRIIGGFKK